LELYDKVVELWRSYRISMPSDIDRYLDSFRVLFAYHSGKIENDEITYHDTREIFENGKVVNYTGSTRAVFEQQNQKLCYEYLKELITKRQTLDTELVREVHRILTSGTYDERRFLANEERPGAYKKHDYVIGVHEIGSAAKNVESDMLDLISEVADYTGDDVLKAAAYFHAMFEFIHPFADGNGRVGRTMMNYFLMTHDHPPLIIFEEDKRAYYACLQKFDETEELEEFYAFLKYETEKTWQKTLQLSLT
jgi:Fic family protein